MVVDGTDAAIIETTLNTDIAVTREREQITVDMLKFWADVAPSFGMIGTMIGLVGMLKNMDDLKGIGDSFKAPCVKGFRRRKLKSALQSRSGRADCSCCTGVCRPGPS